MLMERGFPAGEGNSLLTSKSVNRNREGNLNERKIGRVWMGASTLGAA
jgi:hypothetical protein